MAWRKITAEQYLTGGDAGGNYDEAFIRHPETGVRRECWDVGGDAAGEIAIYTALAEPIMVPRDYPIEVR